MIDKEMHFVKVPECLRWKYGNATAAVWGKVWLYCQEDSGVCHAASERMAVELCLHHDTVLRALKRLTEDGLLRDRTPGRKNRPHHYVVTDKLNELDIEWKEVKKRKLRELGKATKVFDLSD